jgi:NAD(P)-dependent dehydrogenase (short-subunit alcohol dehydrogenase family)
MSASKDGVVIITGGSRGIGKEIALGVAKRGYKVVIGYGQNEVSANAVKSEIEAAGGKAIAVKADMGKEADVLALFKAADAYGPLAGLVNNAGMTHKPAKLADFDTDFMARIFAVNTFGPMIATREAAKRMSTARGGKGGAIVNVSSMHAVYGGDGRAALYAATKAALDSISRGVGIEMAGEGIRVTTVRPGPTETEMSGFAENPGRRTALEATIPMGKMGQPQDVANAVLWLLSDESSYVTGAAINVSGGR